MRARRNLQSIDLGQGIQQFFRQAVGEVFLFLVPAQVHKRQHRNRVRRWGEGRRGGRRLLRDPELVNKEVRQRRKNDEGNDTEQHRL